MLGNSRRAVTIGPPSLPLLLSNLAYELSSKVRSAHKSILYLFYGIRYLRASLRATFALASAATFNTVRPAPPMPLAFHLILHPSLATCVYFVGFRLCLVDIRARYPSTLRSHRPLVSSALVQGTPTLLRRPARYVTFIRNVPGRPILCMSIAECIN
jgi:hypothetical protein